MTDSSPEPPSIDSTILSPYACFTILRCLGNDWQASFRSLLTFMRRYRVRSSNESWVIVANGIEGTSDLLRGIDPGSGDLDELDGLVFRRDGFPSWTRVESAYVETSFELAIALRRDDLIAVHCDPVLRGAILRWLDKEPKPPLARVAPDILQGAFLTGEAKGLWLRGTHVRRSTKADSKNMNGLRLQDTLSPFEDSSFAMSTARAALPDDDSRTALVGNIGTTPRRALVWSGPTSDFASFIAVAIEALTLVAQTMITGSGLSRPYPILATESYDLSQVFGAYDVVTLSADELPGVDVGDELFDAAELLQAATLNIRRGYPNSADFVLDVGLNGSVGGSLRGVVASNGEHVEFSIGYDSENQATNPQAVTTVKRALAFSEELLTVYYDSGHMVDGRSIWTRNVQASPFPGWQFRDFTGYNICKEKPTGSSPADIHAGIGVNNDDSLFSWVLGAYSVGWLTCDDGAGEVADFIHVSPEGATSLIHVKKADSAGPRRRIAVGCYEVVASQAAKNVVSLDRSILRTRLGNPAGLSRATWTDGERVADRTEFLDMFDVCAANSPFLVVIVQPHVCKTTYDGIRKHEGEPGSSEDFYRLNLLETLLNAVRGAITSLGSDLAVIASGG